MQVFHTDTVGNQTEGVFMNSKERLDAFVAGKPVDRRPNLTIVGSVVTQYTGIDIETYCKDPVKMEEAAALAARDLDLDYIQIAADLLRSAEGYGTQIAFSADALPYVVKPALDDIEDVDTIKPLKVADIKRVNDLVIAAEIAVKDPDIYPMVACVGPMTTAANIRGMQDFLMDILDEPELCDKLLETVMVTIVDLIHRLAEVGVKYMYVPDPTASLVPPETYEEHILPLHKRIYAEMEKCGITGRLHMCGDTTNLIPLTKTCGAKIIDVDAAVDWGAALEEVNNAVILNGNISPTADVYDATPEEVTAAMNKCLDQAKNYHAMVMPGCELPTDTARANVCAIADAIAAAGAA